MFNSGSPWFNSAQWRFNGRYRSSFKRPSTKIIRNELGSWRYFGGALLSGLFATPELVLASTIAFLFSELADLAVYTPLQKNRLVVAVVASGIVGLVIDSALFLYVAFGSFDYIGGQIVGKMWMILLAIPVIQYLRKREATEIDETEQQS